MIPYDIGPMETVLKKGSALVESFHWDNDAEAMECLVNDDDLRNALSQEAFECAQGQFS